MPAKYSARQIGAVSAVGFLCLGILSYKLESMHEAAVVPTGAVVGDVTYWKEGDETKARVIRHGSQPLMVEALQGTEPVTGVLITTLRFPECGTIKFQRQALGSYYATADAPDAAVQAECRISDWSGVWRIAHIGS